MGPAARPQKSKVRQTWSLTSQNVDEAWKANVGGTVSETSPAVSPELHVALAGPQSEPCDYLASRLTDKNRKQLMK